MKRSLLAFAIAAVSSGASADTIYGIYTGIGNWQASYDGSAGGAEGTNTAELTELGIDDSDNLFVYLALEHPIPVIPNIRVAHTKVKTDGVGTLTTEFTLDDQTFSANSQVASELDLTHTDGTLYYELLDNWISLDLGLTARLFDGYVEARSLEDGVDQHERVDLSDPIPLLYGRMQIDFPMTGWHVAATGNYIGYSGDSFSDLDAKFGYMSDGFVVDWGIDIGYRRMTLDISDDDIEADLTIDGPYLEASLHF